ncbi:MAG: protein kinase [Polyangiaceae bacterium]
MRPCPQCGTQCAEEHKYCPACGFPVGSVRTTATDDKLIGQELPGGYLILDLLSVGGMGRVYRAEQRVLGRTVAVKIIHPHLLSDENSALRFMTEARAASQLNHPNSISVIDFGRTDDGQPYLVMEFLRGKDLARVAYEDGPLSFVRIVDILRQVLFALSDAHEMGIVHRDLKPENILCEPLRRGGDHVKVVDFGLAKLKQDATMPNVTSPGIVCGTPDYMAPEQGRGDPIDGRTDLYAVGVILFQLLTGRLPFEAESPTQVVMMHLSIPVPDPTQVAPERNIPEPLVAVVSKALEKDAEHRFQDALEFADALKEAIDQVEAEEKERSSGVPPVPVTGSVQCPACESVVPLQKFCGECGARLPLNSVVPEAPSVPSLPLPMVGRDEDLAWLADRRDQLSEEVSGARLVGESGAGKTRLLKEFLARAESAGDLVVYATPDPHGAEVAYYALRETLGVLLKRRKNGASMPDVTDAPAEVAAAIREVFEGPRDDDRRSVLERRFALAEALRWALGQARQQTNGAVIVALDDLHRMDGASRSAFADALGEPPAVRTLILAAHVPGFETGWGAAHAARVISGLPTPAVSRLLKASRPGERLRAIGDAGARGVLPMYVEQVIRFTLEGGKEPPTRLADLVADRVAALEPDARRVLQAIAVLGDDVEPIAFGTMVPNVTDVLGALNQLVQAGMVVRHAGTLSSSHPLIRDVVLAAVPAGVRRDLHFRAVKVCEESGAPIEAHALHAFYSQDSFQALLLLEQVADRASARGDTQAAVLALRRGLELARQEIARGELDDPLRAVLIFSRKLGDALTRAGNFSDAEGVLREALDLAGPSGTDRARVLSALAHVAHGRKRSDEAFEYINEAIEVARKSGAHELLLSLETMRRDWAS